MQIRGLVMSQGGDFEVTRITLDQIALPSVQLPLFTYSRQPVGSIIFVYFHHSQISLNYR